MKKAARQRHSQKALSLLRAAQSRESIDFAAPRERSSDGLSGAFDSPIVSVHRSPIQHRIMKDDPNMATPQVPMLRSSLMGNHLGKDLRRSGRSSKMNPLAQRFRKSSQKLNELGLDLNQI